MEESRLKALPGTVAGTGRIRVVPEPAGGRLLVCVNESPVSRQLVHTARQMAERSGIPWIVVNVQTPRDSRLSEGARDVIAGALRLAESLGAETTTLHTDVAVAGELIRFAQAREISRILLGRPRERHWAAVLRENVGERLLKKGGAFEITVVPPAGEEEAGQRIGPGRPHLRLDPKTYGWATAAVAGAAVIAYCIEQVLPLPNISLVFMVAVLLVAMRFGLWPSLYTSVLSFLAYNFLFTKPYFTFSVTHNAELSTILFFLAVALLVGNLAAGLKAQVVAMRATARRTANLFDFSRRVVAAASLDDLLKASVHHVASTLPCRAVILLPAEHGLEVAAAHPPADHLAPTDHRAAERVWTHGSAAGWSPGSRPAADWHFLPLKTQRGPVGLLGVSVSGRQPAPTELDPEQRRLLDALGDQVAVAIERANLAADIEQARVLTETEQLRSALLSSVSHDLRTPLVSIIGSATSLAGRDAKLSPEDRDQLLQTILEEGERLNRYVQNLLDMTRLGYGALALNKEWADLREIAGRALRRTEKLLRFQEIEFDVPADLPAVEVDPVLVEQVWINLLDNAAKYSPRGSRITLRARQAGSSIVGQVCDQGPGIPADSREAVFDLFYRVRTGDRAPAGTGLGLSICRGLIAAHGGRISARPGPDDHGTVIEFTLPLEPAPDVEEEIAEAKEKGGEAR